MLLLSFRRLTVVLLFLIVSNLLFAAQITDIEPNECNKKRAQQCLQTANELEDDGNYQVAFRYFESMCSNDIGEGCRRMAWQLMEGQGRDADFEEATNLYRKGCNLNDGRSCNNLGSFLGTETENTKMLQEAIILYKKACDLKDAYGCYNLSLNYGPDGAEDDPKRVIELLSKGCEYGDAEQCEEVADIFDDEANHKDSFKYYQAACALGAGYGCNRVGWAFEYGEGATTNFTTANQFYEKACTLYNGAGCNNFARALLHWEDTDPALAINPERGLELLTRACQLGSAQGCTGAGYIYDNGENVDIDYNQANVFFKKGCDEIKDPAASSCYNLALNYQQGHGSDASNDRAKEYFDKACQLGDEEACDH